MFLPQLQRYRLPRSLPAALRVLTDLRQRITILFLYHEHFPEAFATSTAALVPTPQRAYSSREVEFFRLTDEHLFPFPVEQFARTDERSATFWIPRYGPQWSELAELGEIREGWQLVRWFAMVQEYGDLEDARDWIEGMTQAELLRSILLAGLQEGGSTWAFLRTCGTQPEPVCWIPDIYEVCAEGSGNPFYATDDSEWFEEEDAHEPHFDAETFANLADAWAEKLELDAHAQAFNAWIEADPHHAVEVATLWAQHSLA